MTKLLKWWNALVAVAYGAGKPVEPVLPGGTEWIGLGGNGRVLVGALTGFRV